MPKIMLMRTDRVADEGKREAAREFFLGAIDGLNEDDKKAWRRWLKGVFGLEPGEIATIEARFDRSGPYHRRHMAMENAFFDAQERFDQFESFRDWLKIGAGHCTWVPGPKGAIVPIPNSISYAKLDDEEIRRVHVAMVAFMRTPHAGKALWPHLTEQGRADMVEAILGGFNE